MPSKNDALDLHIGNEFRNSPNVTVTFRGKNDRLFAANIRRHGLELKIDRYEWQCLIPGMSLTRLVIGIGVAKGLLKILNSLIPALDRLIKIAGLLLAKSASSESTSSGDPRKVDHKPKGSNNHHLIGGGPVKIDHGCLPGNNPTLRG